MAAMMRKTLAVTVTLAGLLLGAAATLRAQDAKLERGKYLVEEVARCHECHTPTTDTGAPDRSKWLKGAKLGVAPIATITGWHATSPDLTSTSALWQRWGEEGLVKFLETAKNPRGNKADPPMPGYTLRREDAEAIVAYLKTLP